MLSVAIIYMHGINGNISDVNEEKLYENQILKVLHYQSKISCILRCERYSGCHKSSFKMYEGNTLGLCTLIPNKKKNKKENCVQREIYENVRNFIGDKSSLRNQDVQ